MSEERATTMSSESDIPVDQTKTRSLIVETVKQVLVLLRDFPWVAAGAIGTGVGAAILFFYFRSVNYRPADIGTILASGLVIAGLSVSYGILAMISLVAPRAAYNASALGITANDQQPAGFSGQWSRMLLGLYFLGGAAFFGILTFSVWSNCSGYVWHWGTPGVVLLCIGAWLCIASDRLRGHALKELGQRLFSGLWVVFLAILPIYMLWAILVPDSNVSYWDLGMWLLTWMAFVLFSAKLSPDFPTPALIFVLLFFFPALFWSLPTLAGRPAELPTQVVTYAGIRTKGLVELRVPSSTCELIRSVDASNRTSNEISCDNPSGWNTVKAQVLSNLGPRWWIEIKGSQPDGNAFRLSIPAQDVQVVEHLAAKTQKSGRCTRS